MKNRLQRLKKLTTTEEREEDKYDHLTSVIVGHFYMRAARSVEQS